MTKRNPKYQPLRRETAPVTSLPPAPSRRGSLGELEAMQQQMRERQAALAAQVDLVRDLGATWAQVGEALGVSRQAAAERFGGIRGV